MRVAAWRSVDDGSLLIVSGRGWWAVLGLALVVGYYWTLARR